MRRCFSLSCRLSGNIRKGFSSPCLQLYLLNSLSAATLMFNLAKEHISGTNFLTVSTFTWQSSFTASNLSSFQKKKIRTSSGNTGIALQIKELQPIWSKIVWKNTMRISDTHNKLLCPASVGNTDMVIGYLGGKGTLKKSLSPCPAPQATDQKKMYHVLWPLWSVEILFNHFNMPTANFANEVSLPNSSIDRTVLVCLDSKQQVWKMSNLL